MGLAGSSSVDKELVGGLILDLQYLSLVLLNDLPGGLLHAFVKQILSLV